MNTRGQGEEEHSVPVTGARRRRRLSRRVFPPREHGKWQVFHHCPGPLATTSFQIDQLEKVVHNLRILKLKFFGGG